ncbi:YggS family pyridoxal phosphate-dependent enzyme [Saxibacter everestensis]|uniref:Pyridoxal phosphate homeostasis protein n=1 Tax=Saxibacter everestensis TaxID=2909229 RepID=A0ABY8QST5_9MICO|nr:YggS family pyridoxal phosphate-dependent enzyme [Brevibacteriaceae bacterium ZFBP1038]
MSADTDLIPARLDKVRRRADAAAERSGRSGSDVRVMLATKTQPAELILTALKHGFTLIGENRVQEVVAKADELSAVPHETHLIGPLQSNKINHALRHVSCIQSIDRLDIAEKIQRRLEAQDAVVDVYVQVNTSREDSKSGIEPAGAVHFVRSLAQFDRLKLKGLMTIGLPSEDHEEIRPSYRNLIAVQESLRGAGFEGVDELSMGMSHDFELAIEEGATMVRVGSSIFGERPKPR